MTNVERKMLWVLIGMAIVNGAFAAIRLQQGTDPRLEALLVSYCGTRENFDGYCIPPGESCCLDDPAEP